jgi:hypothetical protein
METPSAYYDWFQLKSNIRESKNLFVIEQPVDLYARKYRFPRTHDQAKQDSEDALIQNMKEGKTF